ncbi:MULTISPECIES: SulP family inorganic anion transporter [unclassified Guyparkeria]|uniref:SulP family inorganic anion transporter n=1 Tax=unclassified Guyparkeria TaxID=2626246 RepID=UPI00073387E9|nr:MULTISPECIES: SulP family inorganic anion transporter [unclassified Guyparkeria]KTG17552.1 Bicarbonate transporter BicA [Guyparkeria sp. XI15]OAE88366.1 Bicarbonate transporter BicA [Guyparkeria sp. WRN-7]
MQVFNQIGFGNVKGDVFGGVTAAIVALPMALAFGVASGAGAEAGLYGAVLVGLFAALFGGTPTLISEPTGPMTVVFTAVVVALMVPDPATGVIPENAMAMAFTTVMLAGIFQVVFGVLKLGRYVTLMPYTVISGFMSGIGLILIIIQLPGLLGHASPGGGVLGSLEALPGLFAEVNAGELILGVVALAILFLMPKAWRRFMPPQLLALVVGTLLAVWFIGSGDYRAIGEIPSGLPSLVMPSFSAEDWMTMVINALVLAMLGSIDALLTSVISDSLTRKEHNSDKELVGQGLGNLASGMFGGLPGAGATMGTVVNIQTGARSALSGLVRAGVLGVVVFGASGLVENIPKAILAGIAIKVGIDIIDWGFLRRAHRLSIRGALIMYGVIAMTVFVDLITAVGIGLFVANILTIRRLSDLQSEHVRVLGKAEEGYESDYEGLDADEKRLLSDAGSRVALLDLSGPLIFGAAQTLTRQQNRLDHADTLVIDLSGVPHLGVSAALILERIMHDAAQRGARVIISGIQEQPRGRLEQLGVAKEVHAEDWVATRAEAVRRACGDHATSPGDIGQPAEG